MKKLLTLLTLLTIATGPTSLTDTGCSCTDQDSTNQDDPTTKQDSTDKEPTRTSTKINLNNCIINKDLGSIYIGQKEKPNKTEIWEKIIQLNKNLTKNNFTINDFNIENKTMSNEKVTITGNREYIGQVSLKFSIEIFRNVENSSKGSIHSLIKANNTIYAGTWIDTSKFPNIYTNPKKQYGGLFKKSENDDTEEFNLVHGWKDSNGAIYSMAISPDKQTIWIGTKITGTEGKLFKLTKDTNGDEQITEITTLSDTADAINCIAISPDNTIWIGTNKGLYQSINNGQSFNTISNLVTNRDGAINCIAISPDNTIYVGTKTKNKKCKLIKLTTNNRNISTYSDDNSFKKQFVGAVHSLLHVNGTIYAGIEDDHSFFKLIKITDTPNIQNSDNIIEDISKNDIDPTWNSEWGEVSSLLHVNGTIYAGTTKKRQEADKMKNIGNIYKKSIAQGTEEQSFTEIPNWDENRGAIFTMIIDENNIYVGSNAIYLSEKLD